MIASIGGAYIYGKSQALAPKEISQTTFSIPTGQPSITFMPTNSQVTVNIFKIPELGVEMNISEDLSDLVYVISNTNGVISADFSTTSLTNLDKATGGKYCNSVNSGLGSISKSSKLGHDFSDSKQINGVYYI